MQNLSQSFRKWRKINMSLLIVPRRGFYTILFSFLPQGMSPALQSKAIHRTILSQKSQSLSTDWISFRSTWIHTRRADQTRSSTGFGSTCHHPSWFQRLISYFKLRWTRARFPTTGDLRVLHHCSRRGISPGVQPCDLNISVLQGCGAHHPQPGHQPWFRGQQHSLRWDARL